MKANKKLIAGVVFLVFQAIVILANGLPNVGSGAYGAGYLLGYLATGIIGIALIAAHFLGKRSK